MALKEYKPGTAFNGIIGRTFDVSSPAWPEPLRVREGAPNVCLSCRTIPASARWAATETPSIDLSGGMTKDPEADLRIALARQ